MSAAIVYLLAAVFAIAGVNKFRSQPAFRAVLRNFIPQALVDFAGVSIPVAEIILAVALLNGATMRAALLVTCAMLAVFSCVLIGMKLMGIKGCACFGEQRGEATVVSGIARNLVLILGALFLLGQPTPSLWQDSFSVWLGQMTIVVGAFCLWPCLVALFNLRRFLLNWKPQP